MRLATCKNGQRDGQLVVVSIDGKRCLDAAEIAPTLQAALDDWDVTQPRLQAASAYLNQHPGAGQALDPASLLAPLPRARRGDAALGAQRTRHLSGAVGSEPGLVRRPCR